MRKLLTFTSLFVALVVVQSAKAWNGIGHATIAKIAERNMTDEALEKCRGYLKHSMPYHASWMVYWRNCKGFEETNYWHSVPLDDKYRQQKKQTRNAAYQIKRICKQMKKYHKLSDSIVCDNLKYLIHMVGDMHCPVHTKYVQEHLKQRSVRVKGKKVGFHTYWDGAVGYYHKGMKCDQIAEMYDTFTDEQIAEICSGNPDSWVAVNAAEMQEIYTLLPAKSEVTELSEQTHAKIKEIVVRQVQRGGYRLAHIMNEIFKK